MRGKLFVYFCALFLLYLPLRATHIVGAEMWYECLDAQQNRYQINLRMFRDCLTGQANYDDPISLFIFTSANPSNPPTIRLTNLQGVPTPVPATTWAQCVGTTYPLCVEEGLYSTIVTLPPVVGGYDIGWARCCRNQNIDNLLNPLDQGVTFLAHIPGPDLAVCNNMPTFDNILPTYICAGETFVFDHAATDPDGDSLVYRLSHPYDGLNLTGQGAGNANPGSNQPVVDVGNPMGLPPYRLVNYANTAFDAQNPFGPNSATIDPATGLVTFSPPQIGVYVVAISVLEYRNGMLLSENKRDVQVHVVQCLPQNDPPSIGHTFSPNDLISGDTVIINSIDTACYRVTVRDTNGNPVQARPISFIFSGPDAPTVTTQGTNPLEMDICWDSDCDFAGTTIELIIMGWDETNCPIHNPAFDTVYIRIEPPRDAYPVIGHALPPNNPGGPDTLVVDYNSQACWTGWVADTASIDGALLHSYVIEELNGPSGSVVPTVVPDLSDPDSIPISFCWTPQCSNVDKLYRLIQVGTLPNACPPKNQSRDTMYIYVPALPNPPPVVNSDLNGNVFNADTIFVNVHEAACFQFTVQDTFPANLLDYDFNFVALDGQPAGGLLPTVTVLNSQDSLVLEVCWTPNCDNIDRKFRLELIGVQENDCDLEADAKDTIWFQVEDLINPPPLISHDFLPGFSVDGDTVIISVDSAACFAYTLRDTGFNIALDLEVQTLLLGTQDTSSLDATITTNFSGDTLLTGTVCANTVCDFVGETFLVALVGRDTFDCSPNNWVYDSVYVRFTVPENNPPEIEHFLDGLPQVNGAVEVAPNGNPFCYRIELTDPDSLYADLTAEGNSYIFDTWFRYGNPAEVNISGTNPLLISVCWNPSCYDSGEEFDLVVCGRDTSRCALTPEVCDTVRFRVLDCSIEVENVFTPNGDGINDDFLPFMDVGVQYFRMQIFDRWGKEVFQGENTSWDGSLGGSGGKAMPDGVYYYIFEYQYYSARGVPLKEKSAGWVTLMR